MGKEHEFYESCDDGDCGGTCHLCTLAICKNCPGAEGSLTTHCPEAMYDEDRVYAGEIDFVDGEWYDLKVKVPWSVLRNAHVLYLRATRTMQRFSNASASRKRNLGKWAWRKILHQHITGHPCGLVEDGVVPEEAMSAVWGCN